MTDGARDPIDALRDQLHHAPEAQAPANGPAPAQDAPTPPRRAGDRPKGDIWEGCPIKPLGVSGGVSWYLDALGQLRGVDNHTAQQILHVFGHRLNQLCYRFPQYDKSGDRRPHRFDQTAASMAMIEACAERGVWSPTGRVRGAGAWADDDGNLIYHAGDEIRMGAEWQQPGVYDGKVYAAAEPTPRPGIGGDPAPKLLEHLSSWNWRRPDIDPQLALGVICAQMLGGALEWRPVTWLTGDAATGKSTFQRTLLQIHGGDGGLLQAADATEAGIRSVVGYSSLPVAIDELEPDKDNPRKVKAVIELARRAASGAQIFRGSSDQKGHQSNAYSCFLFSSILVPAMPAQDRQRLILLDLDRLPEDAPRITMRPAKLRELGAQLRGRLIERWPDWPARLDLWRDALAREGQTGRAADNYATVLALADMAAHADLPTPEILANWAKKIRIEETQDSVDVTSNAEDMLFHLMGSFWDMYRRGQRWTVAQWVMAAAKLPGAPAALLGEDTTAMDRDDRAKAANQALAQVGMRVYGSGHDAQLFLASKPIPALCELFRESPWAEGVWSQAARRVQGAEPVKSPRNLAGLSSRGALIPFEQLPGLLAFPADKDSAVVAPSARSAPPDIDDFA